MAFGKWAENTLASYYRNALLACHAPFGKILWILKEHLHRRLDQFKL